METWEWFTQLDLFGGPQPTRPTRRAPGRPRKAARPDATERRPAGQGEASCHDCVHVRRVRMARTYVKCALTQTGGSATDIALRDAACRRFERRED